MKEPRIECPGCSNDDRTMMERIPGQTPTYECKVCSQIFIVSKNPEPRRKP